MTYLTEMDREAKRNARIRSERKTWKEMDDIPSSVLAHIRRRKEKPSRNRWIAMASYISKKIESIEYLDPDTAQRYLRATRDEIEAIGRRKKGRKWVRTERIENVLRGESLFAR